MRRKPAKPMSPEMTKDLYEPEINDRFIRITRADGTVIYASGPPDDGSFDPAEVPALAPSRRRHRRGIFSQR